MKTFLPLVSVVLSAAVAFAVPDPVLEQVVANGAPAVRIRGVVMAAKTVRDVTLGSDPAGGVTAFHVPSNGVVQIPLEKPIELGRRGTIAFWFRPDWLPPASGQEALDMASDRQGAYCKDSTTCGRLDMLNFDSRSDDVGMKTSGGLLQMPGSSGLRIVRSVFPGGWNFAAVSFGPERDDCHGLLNGQFVRATHGWGMRKPFLVREMNFGRIFGWRNGFEGDIAFLKVWDRQLTPDELRTEYAKVQPLAVELEDYAVTAGETSRVRFRLFNFSAHEVKKTFRFALEGKSYEKDVRVAAGQSADLDFNVCVDRPGDHLLATGENRVFGVYAVDAKRKVTAKMKPGDVTWKLVEEFDATKDHPREKMLAEKTKVVRLPSGAYREAGSTIRDAWCWRMNRLAHPNRWHVLEVEHPDDARRYFAVHAYAVNPRMGGMTGGQMESIGVLTGGLHLNTYRTQTRRLMFRPESPDVEVIVETGPFAHVFSRGAAVSRFRVYEADCDLLPSLGAQGGDRELGVWDEDPTMDCDWLARAHFRPQMTLDFWNTKAERIVEYARHMGYTRWIVQALDYNGDRNGSVFTLPNSTTRCASGHVDGWVDVYAKVFEREGLPWYARLGMMYDGQGFYDELFGSSEAAGAFAQKSGEKEDGFRQPDPALPETVAAMSRLMAHYRDKYADSPAFQGVSMESKKLVHYAGPHYGYGERTVRLFERETGVRVPSGDDKSRYAFLMKGDADVRRRWTDWRCDKVVAYVEALVKTLRAGNGRLRMKTFVFAEQLYRNSADAGWKIDDELRAVGLDFARLNAIEGFEIVPYVSPDEETVHGFRGERNARIEREMQNPETQAWLAQRMRRPSFNVIQHSNLECYPGLVPALPETHFPLGYYGWPDSVKKNPYYLSWASCFPNADEALRPWTSWLANADAKEIDMGFWGMPEMGMQERFREFYRAFRSIPAGDYKLVNDPKDPVAVRACGENWYLVNKEGFPVKVNGETVGPCALVVRRGNRPATFRQEVDPKDLAPYRAAAFVLRTADAKIKDAYVAALDAGDVAKARRILACPEGVEVLKNFHPYRAEARWRPGDRTVEVTVGSLTEGNAEYRVSLEADGPVWAPTKGETAVVWMKGGEKKRVLLHPAKFPTKDGDEGVVTVVVASGNHVERFEFLLGGAFAYYDAAKAEVGKDWSFGAYRMRKGHAQSTDPNMLELRFDYAIGYLWNEKGLFVAVDVTEDNVILPQKGQGWNSSPVRSDSLQYFFSCTGGAPRDAEGFGPHDIECFFYDWSDGEHVGGITRFACEAREHQPIANARIHADGHTKYEFHIPAEQLPGVRMDANTVITACHLVNNRFRNRDLWTRFLTSREVFPYAHPGSWPTLTFVKEK